MVTCILDVQLDIQMNGDASSGNQHLADLVKYLNLISGKVLMG